MLLPFLSCLRSQPTIDEPTLQNLNTSPNERAEILFDEEGRTAYGKLLLLSTQQKIKRLHTGYLRKDTSRKHLEITGDCSVPVQEDTERICLPTPMEVSVFAPRIVDSHAARSLFQIRGYETVRIHDLELMSIPSSKWSTLRTPCANTPEECEASYRTSIFALLTTDVYASKDMIPWIFLGKKGLHKKGRFDCDGDGSFETPTEENSLNKFTQICSFPYTAMWTFWKRAITTTKQLRRLGSFFYVYDNNNVRIENIKLTGITDRAMIRATNNESVTIGNNVFSGITSEALQPWGYSFDTPTTMMGTGISIVEGENPPHPFDCSSTAKAKHRRMCLGRNKALGACKNNNDCTNDARCVVGQCKSSQCDTQHIEIHHNQFQGCGSYNWGEKINDDGIQLTSVSAWVHHNTIRDFAGCDALVDVGHRGGCDLRDGEIAESILVSENELSDGKIKTTGASYGKHTVVFTNNEFRDVRISDYHQNWISTYSDNRWNITAHSSQDYLWGERAAIGAQPWQSPTFGAMNIINNEVISEKEKLIVLFTKRWDKQKFNLKGNMFRGEQFIWLKSDGERRNLSPNLAYPAQIFTKDWTIEGTKALQHPKRVVEWKEFVRLVPENEWKK